MLMSKINYRLKQFWIRRLMWLWCFEWWLNVMYPHLFDRTEFDETDNRYWFWLFLNNFQDAVYDSKENLK